MKLRLNQVVYILGDLAVACLAMLMTLMVSFGRLPLAQPSPVEYLVYCLIGAGITLFFNIFIAAYDTMWVYISFIDVFRQVLTAGINGGIFFILGLLHLSHLSFIDILLYCFLLLFFLLSIRAIPRGFRWLKTAKNFSRNDNVQRVIVVGAGDAGAMIIKRLVSDFYSEFYPVALVDNDPLKHGTSLSGVPVVGSVNELSKVAQEYDAQAVIIAIPSASEEDLNYIYKHCLEAALPVKVFQSVVDIDKFVSGNRKVLSDLSIEDLLSRSTVKPDLSGIEEYITGKMVMVTGGAGSIGSELCRQILQYGCGHLIIFDFHENGLFTINEELKKTYSEERYTLCVGNVCDKARLDSVFSQYRPQIVFHAAAHKHVPMMELNPLEAVKNNIFGTENVLKSCIEYGTKRFLLISTDKAVHPTSIMGATKRVAELLVQSMNGQGCEMAAVRFGNVLGSNGSVIPTFRCQIEEGGPVTVTHKDIRRYFMTIPEAVSLVLCAGVQASGGEIFVLDMGEQIRIYDLACNMIRRAGLEPDKDIKIEFIGLRPGEKLYEELYLDSEQMQTTQEKKIFVITEKKAHPEFCMMLERLNTLVQKYEDPQAVYNLVFEIIDEPRTRFEPPSNLSTTSIADMPLDTPQENKDSTRDVVLTVN